MNRNSCPNIHVIGDACIGGGIPKSASAASAQGKACAAAIVALISGKAPETPRLTGACYNTVAPGYAFSLAGVYQPKDGHVRRSRRRATQPGRCAARGARSARRTSCGKLVQDDHGGNALARSSDPYRACRSPACARPALRGRRAGVAPYIIVGDAIPESLTERAATPRAGARWWSSAPAPASSATPARFRNRGFRATSRPTLPAPAAAGRKASFGCGWSTRPASIPRRSCRPIIASTASTASGRLARQADPVGRTDRGYRGVSRKPARIGTGRHDAATDQFNTPPVPRPRRRRGRARRGPDRDAAARRGDARDARRPRSAMSSAAPRCGPARSSSTFRRWSRTATPCR